MHVTSDFAELVINIVVNAYSVCLYFAIRFYYEGFFISWGTVTAYVYNTVYSELTACNPILIR